MVAPGPSLNPEIAHRVSGSGYRVIVCQDAYRLLPDADILYGCDAKWWNAHNGTDFAGEKWSSHNDRQLSDNKLEVAKRYDLNLVNGKPGQGFSTNPKYIHYGDNSGFQSVNLAILFGSTEIVLVGFDMRITDKSHFFGDHPSTLHQRNEYASLAKMFKPLDGVKIVNATPGSAIKCYPMVALNEVIPNDSVYRNGAVSNTVTG